MMLVTRVGRRERCLKGTTFQLYKVSSGELMCSTVITVNSNVLYIWNFLTGYILSIHTIYTKTIEMMKVIRLIVVIMSKVYI